MDDSVFIGLSSAWQAFERSRNRGGHDAIAVRLRLNVERSHVVRCPGTEFGMQDSRDGLIPGEQLPEGGRRFDVGVVARRLRETAEVTFVGPYAHGPRGDQFLYLSWRTPGTTRNWVSRSKFRLTSLRWEELVAADRVGDVFAFDASGNMMKATVPVEWRREPR